MLSSDFCSFGREERRESLREKYAVNMNEEEEEEEEEEFIEDLEDLGGGGGGGKGGNVVGKITRELPNQPKNGFVFGGQNNIGTTTTTRTTTKRIITLSRARKGYT